MIRLLAGNDMEITLQLLDNDHELNLIMINDLERFGIEDKGHTFQGKYFGAFQGDELRGVAVIYNFGSMFIYAPDAELAPELIAHMTGLEKTPRFLSAYSEWAEPVIRRLLERGLRPAGWEEQEFLVLSRDTFKPRPGPSVRFAVPDDLGELIRLSRGFQVEYFGTQLAALDELARTAETRMVDSGITVVERDGKLVAKAEIMARTEKGALIGGVFTEPRYRGRDYCFSCMSLLCESILGDGKNACLNVSKVNIPALRVYKGLGFEKLYEYRMAHFR